MCPYRSARRAQPETLLLSSASIMERSTVITLGILVGVLLVGAAVAWYFTASSDQFSKQTAAGTALQTGTTVEESPFRDLSGEPITLDQFEGRVLVVNSWASWCPFCRDELPRLAEIARSYADEDVTVLAINREESKEQAERFLNSIDADLSGITFVLDTEDVFYESIAGFTMPETVFYDRAGEIVVHKRGDLGQSELRQHVDAVLQRE